MTMTYEDFLDSVQAVVVSPIAAHWRAGQTYFNVLNRVRPDLSERVRATPQDPFNRDDRIPAFLEFVKSNW